MIKWRRAVMAGLAGTVAFDLVGLLLTGRWGTPAMLGAKLGVGFAGGVVAHYANGIILAIIYAGVGPSLWGPNWARGVTYIVVQTVFGVWLFLNPLLGMGIAGLKAGPMAPVISLVRHLTYGLVVAWLYPVCSTKPMGRVGQNHFQRNPPGPLFGLWSARYLDLLKLIRLKLNPRIKAIYERFPTILAPGSAFPDLTLKTVEGATFRMADYSGKKHVVLFTGSIT